MGSSAGHSGRTTAKLQPDPEDGGGRGAETLLASAPRTPPPLPISPACCVPAPRGDYGGGGSEAAASPASLAQKCYPGVGWGWGWSPGAGRGGSTLPSSAVGPSHQPRERAVPLLKPARLREGP